MEELLNGIKKKNLFFTVTTGRSGTRYLSNIFSLLKNFKAEHEAKPAFHTFYRDILDGKRSYKEFWIDYKLPYIQSLKENYYVDVSHVACKGFFESIIEWGIRPSFIFLKRKNREVAKSLLSLGTIPTRTQTGKIYLSSPLDKDALQINGAIDDFTDYQLCYWYTLDIDKRTAYYKDYFDKHNCSYASLTFDELIRGKPLKKIRKSIDLPELSMMGYLKYLKNKGKILNQKSHSKQHIENIDWDKEESELMKRLDEDKIFYIPAKTAN